MGGVVSESSIVESIRTLMQGKVRPPAQMHSAFYTLRVSCSADNALVRWVPCACPVFGQLLVRTLVSSQL